LKKIGKSYFFIDHLYLGTVSVQSLSTVQNLATMDLISTQHLAVFGI